MSLLPTLVAAVPPSIREVTTELLLEGDSPETIFLDGLDSAILGVSWERSAGRVVYSRAKCIEALLSQLDEPDVEVAEEHFEYNVQRTVDYLQQGPNARYAPIILHDELIE